MSTLNDPFLPQSTIPGAREQTLDENVRPLPQVAQAQPAPLPDLDTDMIDRQLQDFDRDLVTPTDAQLAQAPTIRSRAFAGGATDPMAPGQRTNIADYVRPEDRWQVEVFQRQSRTPRGGLISAPTQPEAPTVTAEIPEPTPLIAEFEREIDPATADARTQGLGSSIWSSIAEPFIRQAGGDIPRLAQLVTGREQGIEVRAADAVDGWLARNFPINPEHRDNLFVSTIGPAIGTVGGMVSTFFLTGGLTAAARLGLIGGAAATTRTGVSRAILGANATQTGARVGAIVSSASGNGAEQYRDALRSGASFDDMITAGRLNAVLSGSLDVIPVFRAFSEVDGRTGGSIRQAITRAIGNGSYRILETGASEMLTEAAQTVISNLIASNIVSYDPQRGTFEGVIQSGVGGFTAGALLQTLANLLPGGRRVHFPRDNNAGGVPGSAGPVTPIGPVPFDLLRIADQSTRTEWNEPRTGIEGYEDAYFGLPPRTNRNDFIREQQQRIRDIDAAWKRDRPDYVGDPTVGASLEFYSYLERSEADFERMRTMSPERASQPDVQARMREVEANREVIDILMDPVRMVNRPVWVLQRPARGKQAGATVYLAAGPDGQPIRRSGKKERVVGQDGKDYFIGNARLIQIDNVSPENIVLSPQGQNILRLARMRMQAETQAREDQARAEQQAAQDATSAEARVDRRKAGNAPQLPAPGTRALPPPQGVQYGEGFTARDDTAPASPEATAQALAAQPADQQGELFATASVASVKPETTPSGVKHEPLKPPPLTEAEQLAFDGLTQSSGQRAAGAQRASEIGAAAMSALIPRRVTLDSLPEQTREQLDKRAILLGIKLPDVFSQADLVEAGMPEAEAATMFSRLDDTMRLDGAIKAAKEIRESHIPLRGVDGIMEFYKDLPRRERNAMRKMLKHFERHIGPQLSDLDVIDFAKWAASADETIASMGRKSEYNNPSNSAAFLYAKTRSFGDTIKRAAIALRSEEAGSPATAKAVRNLSHELTHFMIGLTGQSKTDMERLWFKLSVNMADDPVLSEVVRLYAQDSHPAVLAEEFLAMKLEAALADRYETSFEKLEPGQDPSLRTYISEFIRRIYQFVADVYDRILGRDIINDVLYGTASKFGVDLDTYTVDTAELYSPWEGHTNSTPDEVFAKRRSYDGTNNDVCAAVADYYAIRFSGAKAYRNFNRYMEKEFGETWTGKDANVRRSIWEGAVSRMSSYTLDNAYRDGVLSGAPGNPKRITELLGMAKRGEGADGSGRMWYQLSAEEVQRRFRDNADTFLRYLAVTSQGQSVAGNVTHAVNAMAQAAMRPSQEIGPNADLDLKNIGLPEAVRAANQIKATGEWTPTAQKTQAFYRALSKHLNIRDDSTVVIDRWMMRALGYETDNPNATQYAHARLMLESAAKAMGWTTEEVQAAIWVAVKQDAVGKNARDARNYGELLTLNERVLNFEVAPSQNLALGQTFAALSYDDRASVTSRIVSEVMPMVLKATGVEVFHPVFDVRHGGYANDINPSIETRVPMPDWAVDALAASIGYAFRQDSVLITKIAGPQAHVTAPTQYVAIRFDGVENITPDMARAFWDHAIHVEPALSGGYATQGNNLVFFNLKGENFETLRRETFSTLTDVKFKEALKRAAETFTGHDNISISSTMGRGEARLIGNNWKDKPNGEGYRETLERVRPGLADQLNASRALADAILTEEFEARGLWTTRENDETTAGREIAPSIPLGGPIDVRGEGRGARASPDELAGRVDQEATLDGIEPSPYAQSQIYSRAGILQGGVDTTNSLKIYNLDQVIVDPSRLNGWLAQFQANVKYFSFESIPEAGVEEVIPRLTMDGYHKGTLWIYDPRVAAGSFKDTEYTRAWRVTHELAHGITESLMQAKYGSSHRYGRLGRTMEGTRGKGDKKVTVELRPLTLREAQRAVEWEDVAFRAQRMLLADLGIMVSDGAFAQEYNINLSDALYRVITGSFGDPGEYGFLPASKPIDLAEALRLLEQVEFSVARAQGRDPTRGAPLDTAWQPVSDEKIADLISQAKATGLSMVAASPKDDFPGEFFTRMEPGEAAELTSPLAYTNLYAAVLNAPMRAGKATDWRAHFRTQKIPLDELRWSGMLDWMSKRTGLISRDMMQAYVHAADMIVEGSTSGELVLRSNPFDTERTVVRIAYAPRTDAKGRTVFAVQGVSTNQQAPRTELAVRRALRWAIEEGFEGIAWINRDDLNTRIDQRWSGNIYKADLPGGVTFKAAIDNEGVGFIETINIPKTGRRSGIGRRLVNEFEQAVSERNGNRVDGEALPNSLPFWRSMGYTVSDQINEDGTYNISKAVTPMGEVVTGPLVAVEDVGNALSKSFASPIEESTVVVPETEKSGIRRVKAQVLPTNEALGDSVDNVTGIFFHRTAANPMPGYQPTPGGPGNRASRSYWRRMVAWYKNMDALFTQSSKRIRVLGRTKSAFELGNHFRRDPWSFIAPHTKGVIAEDYHSVVHGIIGPQLSRLGEKMSTLTSEQIAEIPIVLRGGNINPATGRVQLNHLSVADARWFRAYMDNILKQTNDHMQGNTAWGRGPGTQYVSHNDLIGKLPNYFPQVWSLDGKFHAGPFRGLSIAAVAHDFFKGLGFYSQHQQQDERIDEMINHIRGENGFVSYASTNTWRPGTVTKFSTGTRERILKIDPNVRVPITIGGVTADVTLNDFLNNDTMSVLLRYTIGMARQAEFNRRFGPKGEEIDRLITSMNRERRAEGLEPLTGAKLDSYIYQIHANLHAHQKRPSEKWAKRQEVLKMVTNANLLFFATIASIPEVMMHGVRGGMRAQMSALGAGIHQVFNSATGQGDTEARRIAKDLGVIRDHLQSSLLEMATNYGQFALTRFHFDPNRVTDKMFRATFLTQWTQLGNVMAVSAAIQSLPHWAEQATAGSQKHERWLREVGLVPADMAGFDPDTYLVGTNTKIDAAIRQMAGETIINPTPGMLPAWHSDPRFKLVAHIKAFMTGFGNTVIQRPLREFGHGNPFPLIWLAGYAALAALTARLWEWIMWGKQGNPSWRRAGLHDRPETQLLLSTISRGGLVGPYQMFVDIIAMNRTAQGGSAAAGWVPSANIVDRVQNLASGTARLVISGFDNPAALRDVVNSATLLVPGLSAAGGWRQGLVDSIVPPQRARAGTGAGRSQDARW